MRKQQLVHGQNAVAAKAWKGSHCHDADATCVNSLGTLARMVRRRHTWVGWGGVGVGCKAHLHSTAAHATCAATLVHNALCICRTGMEKKRCGCAPSLSLLIKAHSALVKSTGRHVGSRNLNKYIQCLAGCSGWLHILGHSQCTHISMHGTCGAATRCQAKPSGPAAGQALAASMGPNPLAVECSV